jgi:hypothetical protein
MELVFLGAILAVCVRLFLETTTYVTASYDTSGGAGQFPQYVLILLMIAVIALMIQDIRKKKYQDFDITSLFHDERKVFFLSLVAYILVIKPFGFIMSTIIYLVFIVNYLYKKYGNGSIGTVKNVIIRNVSLVIFVCAIDYVFEHLMRVVLPHGFLF